MKGWLSAAAFASVAFAAAVPAGQLDAKSLLKRVVSTDGTCGGSAGYTCSTSSYKCCSQWGWCGDSDEHCGTGCQSAYGTCTSGGTPTTTPVTSVPGTTSPPISTGRAKPGSVPYGSLITTCTQSGKVALTFDDGPYIYTSGLLDLLSSNGVKATFFVNGKNWGANDIYGSDKAALVQRMIAEGHQVASHTWDHADLATLSDSQVTTEMTQLETALMSVIGKAPTYMRPPYFSCGSACLNVMNTLGYHVIHTNLDTQDWQYDSASGIQNSKDIFASALNAASSSSSSWIPLTHDVHQYTVESLVQYMITTFKAKGYTSALVGECLGDPSANWYRSV